MIDEAIYTLLVLAGVKVYPLVIPQHEDGDVSFFPCVVYTKVGANRGVRLTGTDNLVNALYQVDSYATTYKAAAQLADAVRIAILDKNGTYAGVPIKTVNLTSEFALEDPDPGLYRITQSFSVWYEE